jgi:hypothetical protein
MSSDAIDHVVGKRLNVEHRSQPTADAPVARADLIRAEPLPGR